MKKSIVSIFSLAGYFFACTVFGGLIHELDVMNFVERDKFALSFGPQDETTEDQGYLRECQSHIDSSLTKLRAQDFVGATEDARKINAQILRPFDVLVSTNVAIARAQRELLKIIGTECAEQGCLNALYLASDVIRSRNRSYQSDADHELQTALLADVIRMGIQQNEVDLVAKATNALEEDDY